MLLNYVKSAFRHLGREKFFSALNIIGLSAALTCSAFIGIWIQDEWQHDRGFEHANRIVRVTSRLTTEKESFEQAVTSVQVAPNLKKDYPEVESYCRIDANEVIVKTGNQQFLEKDVLTVDSTFFSLFNYDLQNGNAQQALIEPYTVVLTESLARKYFGNQNPVGQTLKMNIYDDTGDGAVYRVTGVLKGQPRPAHFRFDMLISFASFFRYRPDYFGEDGWYESSYYTYLMLHQGASMHGLQAKMPDFFQQYLRPLWGDKTRCDFLLQPLQEVYLTSDRRYEIGENGNLNNLYILGSIGVLMLLIAAINYVNMSTARATRRARSVGVRKALGAQRYHLATQFLTESVLTALLSGALALAAAYTCQPVFESITGKHVDLFGDWSLAAAIGGTSVLLGVLAGIYPALMLSGYRPVTALKGNADVALRGKTGLRQVLVVTQFVISVAMMASVFVIWQQMHFIQHKNLGYDKDALLTLRVNGSGPVQSNIDAFREAVTANPGLVSGLAVANVLPAGGIGNSSASTVDQTGKAIETSTYRMRVDYHYADVMRLKLLAGRNFSREFPADAPTDTTQNYLLNAAAVRAFGWETPENAIGKPFKTHSKRGVVVGVVEDFHFNSLKQQIDPLCIHLNGRSFSQILVRVNMERRKEAVAHVEKLWQEHFPDALFDYAFLDERLGRLYETEMRFSALFGVFAVFSILIACLGLLGLAAYAAERRTKEVGIRKVLGASVVNIAALMTKDFLKLVIIAIVIASPLAWYLMQQWLSGFAYRIDMHWWMFAAAGLSAVLIALLTVGSHSVKSALVNPVRSLKNE